ncbi:MAG TPA: PQQ-dependent sugar dehydrogenase [Anaerolineales bacterium]|nr:PQQ-dependent sugar dehydrogenase [Anaerolineales bacterium]
MTVKGFLFRVGAFVIALSLLMSFTSTNLAAAQEEGPVMVNPRLGVRPVITGLDLPTTMAFISSNEFFVLEKNTGTVQYVVDGAIDHTALDLAVNNFSERGLLGIALDPDFESNGFAYLYWSCIAPPPPAEDPFFPTQTECADTPELGADSEDVLAVPLLGNRVDRFVWDGDMLTFDLNLIMLRSFQHDAAPEPPDQGDETQPPRGNHDGGVLAFGQDGKLYIFIGDVGRRGQLQNLPCGPTATCPGETVPDDQFGGPEPDDAHLTGSVLRLNPDGTTPTDNPFFEAGASMGGEVGENIQKIFSYGHRNGFGMAVDPVSGNVWLQENGDDTFSEINRVTPGFNGGWIQVMGPIQRLNQYKEIETTFGNMALQQLRWPPTNIADRPVQARSRLFMLPGAQYRDPAFSWKWEVAPGGLNFLTSRALGPQFENDLFVGAATPQLEGGYLFHFDLTGNRRGIAPNNPRLQDLVADNLAKHDITESESLLIGRNFGAITDIETGPNGNLYVVSLTNGTIYEIFRLGNPSGGTTSLSTELSGAAEVPGPGDPDGSGMANITLNPEQREVCFELTVSTIAPAAAAHIHEGAVGVAGPVVVPLDPAPTNGSSSACIGDVDRALIRNIIQHPEQYYVNVHNADFPAGAVRGQLSK